MNTHWMTYMKFDTDADRKTEPIPRDDYIELENDHLEARCLNCNNAKACKEKHWEGCIYEPKDEKTCETCRYWKYIAHEWQCETTKCQGYTPKTENSSEKPNNSTISKMEQVDKDINVRSNDEPQTETSTKSEKVQLKVQLTDEPQKDMAEDIVRSFGFKAESYQQAKAKDEPQTDCPWK